MCVCVYHPGNRVCLHDVNHCCMYQETLNLCRLLVLGPGDLQVVEMILPRGLKFTESTACQFS